MYWSEAPVAAIEVAIGTLLLNTAVLGAPWPYVVGVLLPVITGFSTFVQLLLDSWRLAARHDNETSRADRS